MKKITFNPKRDILTPAIVILANVATGYILTVALIAHDWLPFFAVVFACALEGLGYKSASLIAAVEEHNRSLNATEQKYRVSKLRSWFPAILYTSIVIVFTVLLKVLSGAYVYSLIALPSVGLLAAWVAAEFRILESHAQSKTQARQAAKDARQAKKQGRQAEKQAPQVVVQEDKKPHNTIDKTRLIKQLETSPGATNKQLASVFGVSAEAVRQARNKLTPADLGLTNQERTQ